MKRDLGTVLESKGQGGGHGQSLKHHPYGPVTFPNTSSSMKVIWICKWTHPLLCAVHKVWLLKLESLGGRDVWRGSVKLSQSLRWREKTISGKGGWYLELFWVFLKSYNNSVISGQGAIDQDHVTLTSSMGDARVIRCSGHCQGDLVVYCLHLCSCKWQPGWRSLLAVFQEGICGCCVIMKMVTHVGRMHADMVVECLCVCV